nr:cyanase [Alexandrium pacificum]
MAELPPAKRARVDDEKATLVARLLAAKEASGKSFDEIAAALGLTNAYTANLFFNQAQLKPGTSEKLTAIVPGISPEDLRAMQRAPMRGFGPAILQEPNVYRTYEAVTHYGEAIKALINEQCGDGIMSAIDFYLDVGTTTGKKGEKRVVITMNGKFLPHIEQVAADNTVPGPRD